MAMRGQASPKEVASASRKNPLRATTYCVLPSRASARSRRLARTESPTSSAPPSTPAAVATPSTTARFVRQYHARLRASRVDVRIAYKMVGQVGHAAYHVSHKLQAVVFFRSQDRLRVELHGFHRQFAMAQSHDDAVVRFGGHFQALRKLFPHREQGVIAAHLKPLGQPFENSRAAVLHPGWLAVHGIAEHPKRAAEGLHHTLQTEAHAEHRNAQPHRPLHQIGYAEFGRAARPW